MKDKRPPETDPAEASRWMHEAAAHGMARGCSSSGCSCLVITVGILFILIVMFSLATL